MRILVTGSRSWSRPDVVADALANQLEGVHYDSVIVHGDCPTGADAQAQKFANYFSVRSERYPAQWNKYGKAAGPKRNQQMVDAGADIVLAFMEEGSRGTKHCVNAAYRAGLPIIVHELVPSLLDESRLEVRRTFLNSDIDVERIQHRSRVLKDNPYEK